MTDTEPTPTDAEVRKAELDQVVLAGGVPVHWWPCVCGRWHRTGNVCPDGGYIL